MARRNVPFLPNQYYHIYNRGAHRIDIFRNDADYVFLLKLVKEQAQKCAISMIAYCLMHNHYHLLLETPEGNLSQGIRQLNGTYTQHFNQKYQRVGHLFQGRFKAILIEKENYLLELSRYIALNPLRAHLVEDPKDWPWSAYPQAIGFSKKIVVRCLYVSLGNKPVNIDIRLRSANGRGNA